MSAAIVNSALSLPARGAAVTARGDDRDGHGGGRGQGAVRLVVGAIADQIGTGAASASAAVAGGVLMAVSPIASGVVVASRSSRWRASRSSLQLLLFPMLFVSGALFPLSACPAGRRGSGQPSHSASPGS